MIVVTHVSNHGTGSLRISSNRLSFSRAGYMPKRCAAQAIIRLCCCLAGLCACTPSCWAQSSLDSTDNQTLAVRFISLKPGNTIGASHLILHANGTLDFSIEGETLTNTGGTWSTQKKHFAATIDFTVDKRASFHYRLNLDGYRLMGLHAGRAHISEYERSGRLTQEIRFLFYAAPPEFPTAQQRFQEGDAQ